MAEIVEFPGDTRVPEDPSITLEKAKAWNMTKCMVIGWDQDDNLQWGGSFSEVEGMLFLLECAKRRLMDAAFGPSA